MSTLINLTKKAGIVLEKNNLKDVRANIVLVVDNSISMSSRFSSGEVQSTITKLLAVGMNMDSNKSIDVFTFSNSYQYIGEATEANHQNFVRDNKMKVDGGTYYAPVIRKITESLGEVKESKGFFSKFLKPKSDFVLDQSIPTIVFFITDGDNFDVSETTSLIQDASNKPIFWQFVGIGNGSFRFLKHLDNMEDRVVDNANFFELNEISSVTEETLYNKLLVEIPIWLKEIKAKSII